jgi:hypothetical protein
MKKVLVLLALVVVGALVFAEDAPTPQYQFSASATGGWKYNLDNQRSTFINDWDISLKYQLLNDLTKSKGADSGTYGFIEVKHINIRILEDKDGGTAPQGIGDGAIGWTDKSPDDGISVTAKIVSGPIEVGLYGAPGTNFENAKYVPLFEKDAGYTSGLFGDAAIATASSDSGFKANLVSAKGLSAKYTFGTFGFVQLAAANTDITSADPQYLFGANVEVKPVASDALTVTVDGGFWTNTETSDMILTGKAAVAAGALSASAAFDGGKAGASGSVFQWDAAANLAYALFEKKDSINLDVYAVSLTDTPGDDMATDLGFKFVDAEGLVPGLSFTAGFFWFDLLDNGKYDPKTISFAESISYKYALSDTTYVKPYQALRYDLNDLIAQTTFGVDSIDDAVMYLNVGVEAQFFPNCVFTVDYFKGAKDKDNNENLVQTKDASEFAITAKVSL